MKHQIKIALLSFVTIGAFIGSHNVWAHAEKDKSRYISPTGVDIGLCDNPLRPCKTLVYGISRASKGDKILLSAGEYTIETVDEVLALNNTLVPILGGYNRFDHFSNQSPSTNTTTLNGIPFDMISHVRGLGFNVNADGKKQFSKQRISEVNRQYRVANTSHAAASCVDGIAAGFACDNMDLVAHIALNDFGFRPNAGNDIWGHVDLNTHTEYAIMGILNGVAIFDLSNPESPREVGSISGLNSSWRDVKVYQFFDQTLKAWQAYAYVTIDSQSDFVSIIDLNQLPNSVSLVTKDRAVSQAHNVYISNVDYALNIPLKGATPTLQLVGASGANVPTPSFVSYSLADPKALTPLALGDNLSNGYTHDGTSLRIDDERKNSDCNNEGQTCEIFVDFNEKEIKIWNVTSAGQETQLSQIKYTDVPEAQQYVHSGWWSEDKRYIFAHDEFDESRAGINTTLRIFDLQSLTSPTLAGVWTGPTAAIDHNGFVRGNRYYMSNYTRGVTVLDISNPASPSQVGFFDTYSPSNSASYNGAWGIYPFLPSGLILASDISGGLFVLRDNTRTVPQGTLSFVQESMDTESNNTISISVARTNGTQDAITVGWEIVPGSAIPSEDYTDNSGTLSWAAGDSSVQQFNIDVSDNVDSNEIEEQFFVRLFNPTNGATISSPHYFTVNIEGVRIAGTIGFEHQTLDINEQDGPLSVSVFRSGGSAGALSVSYVLTADTATIGEDVVDNSGTLNWADGNTDIKTIEVVISDDQLLEDDETVSVVLTAIGDTVLSTNNQLDIVIKDNEQNTAPTITIIENFDVNTNQTTQLTSSATDAESDALTYAWSQTSGTAVDIVNASMNDASFISPNQAQTLSFKLVVTDSRGASSQETVDITVKEPVVTPPAAKKSSSGSLPIGMLLSLLIVLVWRKNKNSN